MSSSHPAALASRSERGAVVALCFLALINLINYYDRMLVVVVSEPLRLEFDLTDTQFGILTGPAFVLVYAVASLFFGYQADRRNRRNILALVVGLWSVTNRLVWHGHQLPDTYTGSRRRQHRRSRLQPGRDVDAQRSISTPAKVHGPGRVRSRRHGGPVPELRTR